jgi:hypothetical protein
MLSRDPVIGLLYHFEIKGKGEGVVSNSWRIIFSAASFDAESDEFGLGLVIPLEIGMVMKGIGCCELLVIGS